TSGGGINLRVQSIENLTAPGTGQFYAYETSGGSPVFRLSSSNGYNNSYELSAGGHSHVNLALTASGMFRVWFVASGTLVATGETIESQPLPLYFGVETWQIPAAVEPLNGYEAWKLASFSPTQAEDPLVSGPAADPDGDGADNLVEYALGGNPTNAAGSLGPTVSTTNTSGTNWLRFAYRARTNDPALVIQPVFKVSLTETNWSTNVVVQKISGQPTGDGVYEDQVWQTPLGADVRRFLRLKISR
ncbi:MAG: hypothetical protein EBT69_08260, partial [Verrucomicrobia bacterium]|nr:hypothetical protein [Verrucomicrobiota bacterium]